jgi:LPXTG-motif cell wall-anchored protein
LKVRFITVATLAAALALGLLGSAPALAQAAPSGYPCGRVNAYTAPTATAAGSITIGTTTFDLAPGSAPATPIAVGSELCIHGPRNAAGAFTAFTVSPMGEGICATVVAYTPPTATAAGSITFDTPDNGRVTLSVRPGTTLSQEQVTGNQCFRTGVNAEGNAEVNAYLRPGEGAAPAPGQLPSTSTAPITAAAIAALTILVAGGSLVTLRRRRD